MATTQRHARASTCGREWEQLSRVISTHSLLGGRAQALGEWIALGQCLAHPTKSSLLVALNHGLWLLPPPEPSSPT